MAACWTSSDPGSTSCLCLSAVVCSFRGSISQGLVLDLGETVHILEKCEGEDQDQVQQQDQDQDQGPSHLWCLDSASSWWRPGTLHSFIWLD